MFEFSRFLCVAGFLASTTFAKGEVPACPNGRCESPMESKNVASSGVKAQSVTSPSAPPYGLKFSTRATIGRALVNVGPCIINPVLSLANRCIGITVAHCLPGVSHRGFTRGEGPYAMLARYFSSTANGTAAPWVKASFRIPEPFARHSALNPLPRSGLAHNLHAADLAVTEMPPSVCTTFAKSQPILPLCRPGGTLRAHTLASFMLRKRSRLRLVPKQIPLETAKEKERYAEGFLTIQPPGSAAGTRGDSGSALIAEQDGKRCIAGVYSRSRMGLPSISFFVSGNHSLRMAAALIDRTLGGGFLAQVEGNPTGVIPHKARTEVSHSSGERGRGEGAPFGYRLSVVSEFGLSAPNRLPHATTLSIGGGAENATIEVSEERH